MRNSKIVYGPFVSLCFLAIEISAIYFLVKYLFSIPSENDVPTYLINTYFISVATMIFVFIGNKILATIFNLSHQLSSKGHRRPFIVFLRLLLGPIGLVLNVFEDIPYVGGGLYAAIRHMLFPNRQYKSKRNKNYDNDYEVKTTTTEKDNLKSRPMYMHKIDIAKAISLGIFKLDQCVQYGRETILELSPPNWDRINVDLSDNNVMSVEIPVIAKYFPYDFESDLLNACAESIINRESESFCERLKDYAFKAAEKAIKKLQKNYKDLDEITSIKINVYVA